MIQGSLNDPRKSLWHAASSTFVVWSFITRRFRES